MNEQSIKPMIESLEELFSKFNAEFYGGTLQKPVLLIASNGKKPAYGWCSNWRAWGEDDDEQKGYFEICIVAEYLNREPEEVAETLLHEMAHLYDAQNGIKDSSRGGTYHNKKFKEAAEAHGLTVTKSDKYGWAQTELNAAAAEYLKSIDWKGFSLFRRSVETEAKKQSQSYVYTCPVCGVKVRSTKMLNLVCGDCNEPMICS